MGSFILISIIAVTAFASLVRPWIGIIAYYLLAILGPQYIWFWDFRGLRVSFVIAISTLLGITIKLLNKQYDIRFLVTKQNRYLFFLWIFITISYYFGPYVLDFNSYGRGPDQLYSVTNTIFIFYFCASLVITDIRKVRYLSIVILISTIYLIYWANIQYFTSNWDQFNMGRLMGPESIEGGSIYRDENTFAMLFVTGIPFIFYLGYEINNKLIRYVLWCIIPFGWHAVFLTGSRGGLVGLIVITFLIILKANKKIYIIPLLLAFLVFYQWQAGSTMKERSETIDDYHESSAQMRIDAWKGGLRMIIAHPFSGVGLGSFVTALPHYYDTNPRVAHNTFIQFTAESGIGAGICYLMILSIFIKNSNRISAMRKEHGENSIVKLLQNLNNANTISFAGLLVCSLFLSLTTYEVFFYLLVLNNALIVIVSQSELAYAYQVDMSEGKPVSVPLC